MWRYVVQRLALAVPTLLGVVTFVFVAMRLVPGDPAAIIAGDYADAETLAKIRAEWGFDRPLPVQYVQFLANLARAEFGVSIRSRQPVLTEIGSRFEVSLLLAVLSILIAVAIGGAAGIVGAMRPYTAWDYGSMVIALVGVSTPIFWSGMILVLVFSLRLNWLPTGGIGTLAHFVLPAVSLGFFNAGVIARQTRSSLLDCLAQDYVRTARAKGVPERRIIFVHALRNGLISIVTIVGLQFGRLLAGAILVETVFNLPGLGNYLVIAIFQRDYPVIQVIMMVFALTFMFINLLIDMTYPLINPQIRL